MMKRRRRVLDERFERCDIDACHSMRFEAHMKVAACAVHRLNHSRTTPTHTQGSATERRRQQSTANLLEVAGVELRFAVGEVGVAHGPLEQL